MSLIHKTGVRLLSGSGIGQFYLVQRLNNYLFNKIYSNHPVEVSGHRMFLAPNSAVSNNIIRFGVHESVETELVKTEVKYGDIVLDLGANIGYYSLIFAGLVGKTGRVFAFEPEPTNFTLLQKNVDINSYRNMELVQKAASNKTGKAKLYLGGKTIGQHSMYELYNNKKSIEVETIRLDDYFKDFDNKINFIKMDIEGAELVAIEGMTSLLQRNKKLKMLVEFNPRIIKKLGQEPLDLPRALLSQRFKLYNVNERNKQLDKLDINDLSEMNAELLEKATYANLVCVRE